VAKSKEQNETGHVIEAQTLIVDYRIRRGSRNEPGLGRIQPKVADLSQPTVPSFSKK
jgi:hypothetical protein